MQVVPLWAGASTSNTAFFLKVLPAAVVAGASLETCDPSQLGEGVEEALVSLWVAVRII